MRYFITTSLFADIFACAHLTLNRDIEVSGDRRHPALREYELIKQMKQGKMGKFIHS